MYSLSFRLNASNGVSAHVLLVEELVFHASEESLAGRVVRRTGLPRHRPGDPVFLAYPDPAGPPAVATAITVEDRRLPVTQRVDRVEERAVGQSPRPGFSTACGRTGLPSKQSTTADR